MIDSTPITKKIEDHKSTIIEELEQSESQIKKELKKYEENLTKQMKEDLEKLQSSFLMQEKLTEKSLSKLLKWVSWKVLIPVSLLSIIIGLLIGTQITEPKQEQQMMYQKEVMKDKNGKAYIQFNQNELFYDKARQMYYYQIK